MHKQLESVKTAQKNLDKSKSDLESKIKNIGDGDEGGSEDSSVGEKAQGEVAQSAGDQEAAFVEKEEQKNQNKIKSKQHASIKSRLQRLKSLHSKLDSEIAYLERSSNRHKEHKSSAK